MKLRSNTGFSCCVIIASLLISTDGNVTSTQKEQTVSSTDRPSTKIVPLELPIDKSDAKIAKQRLDEFILSQKNDSTERNQELKTMNDNRLDKLILSKKVSVKKSKSKGNDADMFEFRESILQALGAEDEKSQEADKVYEMQLSLVRPSSKREVHDAAEEDTSSEDIKEESDYMDLNQKAKKIMARQLQLIQLLLQKTRTNTIPKTEEGTQEEEDTPVVKRSKRVRGYKPGYPKDSRERLQKSLLLYPEAVRIIADQYSMIKKYMQRSGETEMEHPETTTIRTDYKEILAEIDVILKGRLKEVDLYKGIDSFRISTSKEDMYDVQGIQDSDVSNETALFDKTDIKQALNRSPYVKRVLTIYKKKLNDYIQRKKKELKRKKKRY